MGTTVTDRRTFSTWEKETETNDIRKRACSKIDKLLEAHDYFIDEKLIEKLDEIIAENEKIVKEGKK